MVSPLFASATVAATSASAGSTDALIQCINPSDDPNWDAALVRHPQGSFFHSAAWAAALENTYGFKPDYFVTREAGALKSLFPVMEVNSWLTGRRGVALPFTDDCEPICPDAESFKNILQRVTALGRERGWKYIEFRGGRKSFGDAPASLAFYGHELELSGGEEELFGRVESSVRRAIRKAEKSGVKMEVSDSLEAVKEFYTLLCRTRKKHGMPPQSFSFFRNIHEQIFKRKLGRVIMARFEGQPVAASVYFGLGNRAIYKYGASDERFQHLRGNNLVMWEAIKWHAQRDYKSLNLGRTSLSNDGLRRFKLGWGAAESRMEYTKYNLREDRFLQDKDETAGWHTKVFQRLPIPVSRMIGSVLYRHWA